jgi:adhesin/invasin
MLKINKILSKKIKSPLSLRGLFPLCHSRESGNPSYLSLRARKQSNNSGFSLIELMVAAAILSLAIYGIFQAYTTGFLGMFDARDRTVATNYVQEKMEELKNADFDTVVDEASSQIVGDIKFSRNVNVEYIDGSTNLIAAETTNLKRVTTTVNWSDRNGVAKKVESSVLLQNTQFTPGDAARISLYANPYNVVLPITSSTTIIAVIKDNSGNTIINWDGSDVTFTIISEVSPEGVSLGAGVLGSLSAYTVTPVQGKASVIFTSSVAEEEGTVTVEASVTTSDGLNTFTDTIDIGITWGAVKIELIPNPSSILANGTSQSTITATIQNAAGGTVDDGTHDVTFTVAGEGTLIGSNPETSTLGIATITLQSTTTAGIATVTASSPNLISDSCNVQTSGEPAGVILSASPNQIYSDDTSTVTVTIVDENGVPVIPTSSITINLSVSEGSLSNSTLIFDDESSIAITYTPFLSTEGIITITATGAFTGSVDISVELKLVADHIVLNAEPFNIPADGGDSYSTITATIKNSEGITVHNYDQNITFSIIFGDGTLSVIDGVVTCVNGVATIQLYSGAVPGTCQIQAESGSLPSTTIDVGFYTTADYILLTAVPVHIPVGGGNERTSILTASIKDANGTTVYNYDGDVLFSFLSGHDSTAKFKFVTQSNYSVPVFKGSASVYLLSLNNSGDATLEATSGSLTPDDLTLYIQKILREPVPPNITYDADKKGVSFDIEVLGGNMQIDDIEVVWSPNGGEQLLSIKFDTVEVFSGSILSGEDIVITPTVLYQQYILLF